MEIKILTPISFLKAGFTTDDLSHIISFRRQTHIPHEDISKLPGSLLINFEDTDYRVFLTDDTLTCYICKNTGHTSAHCKSTSALSSNPLDHQNNYYTQLSNNTFGSQIITNIIPKETPNNTQFNTTENMESEHIEKPPNITLSPSNFTSSIHLQMLYTKINEEKTHTQIPNVIHNDLCPKHLLQSHPHRPPILLPNSRNMKTQKPQKKSKFALALTHHVRMTTWMRDSNTSITFFQFKHIFKNFTIKSINVHTLIDETNTDARTFINLIEEIRLSTAL
jgi:hypothetical protein